MRKFARKFALFAVGVAVLVTCAAAEAQPRRAGKQPRSAIKLFTATPVTESAPCVISGACAPVRDRVVFDQAEALLSCRARPSAVLSSTPDGRGRLVVDNFMEVNGRDVCTGGVLTDGFEQCFNPPVVPVLGTPATTALKSVAPIDVSDAMPRGKAMVTFSLVDYGGIYANTDIWLVTDCTLHQKASICHKPGTPAEKILTVGGPAIAGHLRHGDTLDLTACRR
jgi:hypothetical protein